MLGDIREGSVDCVVVKDLSRFGRNYIESGRYIEKIFPMLGVRFIAVNNGYDSLNEQYGNDMVIPFKNLINDAYCRDISVKIRSHMEVKRKNGEYIGAFAVYGYLKDPEDKNHLVVDEYAADVVRDIFAMKLCGMNPKAIAEKLNRDGILSPLQYKKSIGIRLESPFRKGVKPRWSYNAVLRILKNEVYLGTVVQGKCTTPNYKIKKRVYKDESEWIRAEGTHDAVVGRGEFALVQSFIGKALALSEAADIISRAQGADPDVAKFDRRIGKLREEAESCSRRRKNLYEDFKGIVLELLKAHVAVYVDASWLTGLIVGSQLCCSLSSLFCCTARERSAWRQRG